LEFLFLLINFSSSLREFFRAALSIKYNEVKGKQKNFATLIKSVYNCLPPCYTESRRSVPCTERSFFG
jgi:hypothetical protein